MIYLLASLQIRHDPSVHADPGRIFLHLQKQMSYLWVSTAHNRSYQDATTITKAERINIAITFKTLGDFTAWIFGFIMQAVAKVELWTTFLQT